MLGTGPATGSGVAFRLVLKLLLYVVTTDISSPTSILAIIFILFPFPACLISVCFMSGIFMGSSSIYQS